MYVCTVGCLSYVPEQPNVPLLLRSERQTISFPPRIISMSICVSDLTDDVCGLASPPLLRCLTSRHRPLLRMASRHRIQWREQGEEERAPTARERRRLSVPTPRHWRRRSTPVSGRDPPPRLSPATAVGVETGGGGGREMREAMLAGEGGTRGARRGRPAAGSGRSDGRVCRRQARAGGLATDSLDR
jgi:hypothetical protein